jgi:hypothetical protein
LFIARALIFMLFYPNRFLSRFWWI